MPVISTTLARHSPIAAPMTTATAISMPPVESMSSAASAITAASAIAMPAMP